MFPIRDTYPSQRFPVVTAILIAINALVFFFEMSLDQVSLNDFMHAFGTVPRHFEAGTLLSSMFLHGGWSHFLGNMWFLWIYGDNVEDILGRVKYAIFYIVCGLVGGIAHTVTNLDSVVPAIGASGAIAGVMGAYLLKFPHSRIVMFTFPMFVFELPAVIVLIGWFVLQFFSSLGSLGAASDSGGTAFFAHIGGFLAGMALIKLMPTSEPYRTHPELRW